MDIIRAIAAAEVRLANIRTGQSIDLAREDWLEIAAKWQTAHVNETEELMGPIRATLSAQISLAIEHAQFQDVCMDLLKTVAETNHLKNCLKVPIDILPKNVGIELLNEVTYMSVIDGVMNDYRDSILYLNDIISLYPAHNILLQLCSFANSRIIASIDELGHRRRLIEHFCDN